MAPKKDQSSQQATQGSVQPTALQKKFKDFCQEIEKASKKSGPIKATTTLNDLTETLRTRKRKTQAIDKSSVAGILVQLENEDGAICSRLEPAVFSLIAKAALQAEPCRESERTLYLLASSLHRESLLPDGTIGALSLRKEAVGKLAIFDLMEYFAWQEMDVSTRRMAGLLCIQLHQGCEKVHEKIGLATEALRRNLGWLVINEADEISRLIGGQFIRDLHEAGIPHRHLFPVEYDEELYSDFPPSTQDNEGWVSRFSLYVDSMLNKKNFDVSSPIGEPYFVGGVELTPDRAFGDPVHNCYLIADEVGKTIVIFAPARDDQFDRLLELPLSSVRRATFQESQDSQADSPITRFVMEVHTTPRLGACLDAKAIQLEHVSMVVSPADVDAMKEFVGQHWGAFEVTNETQDSPLRSFDERIVSQASRISTCEITADDESQPVPNMPRPLDMVQKDKGKGKENARDQDWVPTPAQLPDNPVLDEEEYTTAKEGIPESVGRGPDDSPSSSDSESIAPIESRKPGAPAKPTEIKRDPKSSKPPEPAESVHPVELSPKPDETVETTESAPKPAHFQKARFAVKPKGKQPLVPARKSLDSQMSQKPDLNGVARSSQLPLAREMSKGASIAEQGRNTIQDSAKSQSQVQMNVTKHDTSKQSKPLPPQDASSPYDLPGDDEDEKSQVLTKKKTAAASSKASSKEKTLGKTKFTKQKADKRKSAPAAMESQIISQSRTTRRAAADKAKDKMRGQDDDFDDDIEIDEVVGKATKKKSEPVHEPSRASGDMLPPARPDVKGSKGNSKNAHGEVTDLHQLEEEDARTLGLMQVSTENDAIDGFMDDDLYSASPQRQKGPRESFKSHDKASTASNVHQDPENQPVAVQTEVAIISKTSVSVIQRERPPSRKSLSGLADGLNSLVVDLGLAPGAVNQTTRRGQKQDIVENVAAQGAERATTREEVSRKITTKSTVVIESSLPRAGNDSLMTDPIQSLTIVDTNSNKVNSEPLLPVAVPESATKSYEPLENEPVILSSTKRKGIEGDDSASKRQCKNEVADELQRCTPVQAKDEVETATDVAAKGNVELYLHNNAKTENARPSEVENLRPVEPTSTPTHMNSKKKAETPKRLSPRVATRSSVTAERASKALQAVTSNGDLVDETLTRKPQVISFGPQGARNQGASSTVQSSGRGSTRVKETAEPVTLDPVSLEPVSLDPVSPDLPHKKRKRGPQTVDAGSPASKKRQYSNPLQAPQQEVGAASDGGDEGEGPLINSSPPVQVISRPSPPPPSAAPSTRDIPNPRLGSQSAKVKPNGSPMAKPNQRDHIGALKVRLLEDAAPEAEMVQPEAAENRPRSFSSTFGPRVQLSTKTKAKPSPPEVVITRFVAHEKTVNGQYQDFSSKQVIKEAKDLFDPFTGQTRRDSGFTKNLLKKGGADTKEAPKIVRAAAAPKSKANGRRAPVIQGPPSLESGESSGSSSPCPPSDREPLKKRPNASGMWNMAVRTHLGSAQEAIHHIADQMIISLAHAEDKMDLLADQYKQNGAKFVDQLAKKRTDQRATVLGNIDGKKQNIVNAYMRARGLLVEVGDDAKENSAAAFEQQWKKTQSASQKAIHEGRRVSE